MFEKVPIAHRGAERPQAAGPTLRARIARSDFAAG
jgi:hypothetical protein